MNIPFRALTEKPDFKWVVRVTALFCLRLQVKGKRGEGGCGRDRAMSRTSRLPSRVIKKLGSAHIFVSGLATVTWRDGSRRFGALGLIDCGLLFLYVYFFAYSLHRVFAFFFFSFVHSLRGPRVYSTCMT